MSWPIRVHFISRPWKKTAMFFCCRTHHLRSCHLIPTPDPTAKCETRHWVSVSVLEMTHHKPHSVGIQLPLGDPSACPHAKATMFPTHPAYRIVAPPPSHLVSHPRTQLCDSVGVAAPCMRSTRCILQTGNTAAAGHNHGAQSAVRVLRCLTVSAASSERTSCRSRRPLKGG